VTIFGFDVEALDAAGFAAAGFAVAPELVDGVKVWLAPAPPGLTVIESMNGRIIAPNGLEETWET
jgi:hypothetical protein